MIAAVERLLCVLAGAVSATLLLRLTQRRKKGPALEIPKPSTIRLMTRLAVEHGAVNLSQGFPNEAPPREMCLAAAGALLGGATLESAAAKADELDKLLLKAAGSNEQLDSLNQYSYPFGAPHLRAAIARYYRELYPEIRADPEDNLTVVLGATEGFAVCLRALCCPSDAVVFFQPFHELYPSQCKIWGLEPRAVTLYEAEGEWRYDAAELESAMRGAAVLLFNSPHNPTGKVFSSTELEHIRTLCIEHDVLVVTDEIYEHIVFDGATHTSLAQLDGMAERALVVNALSKTARATGWRVGWVIAPKRYTPAIRAVHDQLVLQAPTPLQVGAAALLVSGKKTFDAVADEYMPKRQVLLDALRRAGFEVGAVPQGAYYLFVGYRSVPALAHLSPTDAAMHLIREYKVACVPGDNFYYGDAARADPMRGGRYLRFTFVRSLDVLHAAAANLQKLA